MSKKIKVLFTIPNFTSAGSGREMFNIIERLDKNIIEPWIAVQQSGGNLYDEIVAKGYPVLAFPFTAENPAGLFQIIMMARKYADNFKKYSFDAWLSFNWSSDYTEALVARFAGAKYCYVKKNMNWNRMAWKVKSFLSHRIIARNKTLTETCLSHWLYKKKAVFITGGVDVNKFRPGISSSTRNELQIPQDVILISCVAQLVRVKDQLTLVKSISGLENVYLVLAGTEKDIVYANELKQLVSDLDINGRIRFTGTVNNINELLNASDIFVLPTSKLNGHEEGCPVAVLEAMSAGVPVIASDVAGNRDLIIHEKTGLLFEPGNITQLTACIKKYITEPAFAGKMADAALKKVHTEHTLDIEANAFTRLLKTVCNN